MNTRFPFFRCTVVVGGLFIGCCAGARAADAVVHSAPLGVMAQSFPVGTSGLTLPLIEQNALVGVVAANSAFTLTLDSRSPDPRLLLTEVGPCFIEIITGPLEGERLDVDLTATLAGDGRIVLSSDPNRHCTLRALPEDALIGARVAVRPHLTLAALQRSLTPGLAGSDIPRAADAVHVFTGSGFVRYHLAADGVSWIKAGETGDFRHLVLPPDAGVLLELTSGAKHWLHEGVVRTNGFRKNLIAGTQPFATGFPQDLSPVQAAALGANGWTGGDEHEEADWLERQAAGAMPFSRYFLRSDGASWKQVNDNHRDFAHVPILRATEMFVLRRLEADASYAIPVPFAVE